MSARFTSKREVLLWLFLATMSISLQATTTTATVVDGDQPESETSSSMVRTEQDVADIGDVNGAGFEVRVRRIVFSGLTDQGLTEDELLKEEIVLPTAEASGADAAETVVLLRDIGGSSGSGRSMGAAELNRILHAISLAYTKAGFAAVKATITRSALKHLSRPEGDGVLVINVIEGQVGDLRTLVTREGKAAPNDMPSHERILARSPVQVGDLVEREQLNEYVERLNRQPGRHVDVTLLAGAKPDELTVNFLIAENKPFSIYTEGSNTGTDETSDWRERFGFFHHNLTGHDDTFSFDYITANFNSFHAVTGSYQRPLATDADVQARVFGSWYRYDSSEVGVVTSLFTGEGYEVGGELNGNLFQNDSFFVDAVGGGRFKHVSVDNRTGGLTVSDGSTDFFLAYLGLRAEQNSLLRSLSASMTAEMNFRNIGNTDDSIDLAAQGRVNSSADFTILRFGLNQSFYLEPLMSSNWQEGQPGSTLAHELVLTGRGQIALNDRRLTPSFTETIGGFHTVRGYPQAFTAADNAYIGSVEYRFHLPRALAPRPEPDELFGRPFHVHPSRPTGRPDWDFILRAFADVGYVKHNQATPFEQDVMLVGSGFGAELVLHHNLFIRADWAFALKDANNGADRVTSGSSQVHLSFTVLY